MDFFNLGHVPWLDSQLIYHALPRVGMEGLILLAPAEPYICIGYHQDAEQEVDLAYCREQGISVFRREVGGGAVYLDGHQLFFQLILHKDNPICPKDKAGFYRKFLSPVVQTYCDLGVETHYKPVNDIVTVEGRKISGNGAAEIGDFLVLVGNVIVDFDYETMVRLLRVPDAKFRDKVFKTMRENLTTLRRELDQVPTWQTITDTLARNFETVFGPLSPATLPDAVREQTSQLTQILATEEWLLRPGNRFREGRRVKIAEGVEVIQRAHKAPGGLIRTTVHMQRGQIVTVGIFGDFFFYPADRLADLEEQLAGTMLDNALTVITRFYQDNKVESPGVTPQDLAAALGAPEPVG